jgi:hypothetical protein
LARVKIVRKEPEKATVTAFWGGQSIEIVFEDSSQYVYIDTLFISDDVIEKYFKDKDQKVLYIKIVTDENLVALSKENPVSKFVQKDDVPW